MQTIIKHYKVIKYCQYEEVNAIGDASGMSVEFIGDYITSSGHLCKTKLWLNNDTGDGWETREFTICN